MIYEIIGNTTTTPVAPTDLSQVANAIKETVSGTVVTMNDVSPLEHNIKVKLSAELEVVGEITSIEHGEWTNYPNYGEYVVDHIDYEDTNGEGRIVFTDGSSLDCGMCLYASVSDIQQGDTIRFDYDREYDDPEYWHAYLLSVGEEFKDALTELSCLSDNSIEVDFRAGYGDYIVLSKNRDFEDNVRLSFTDGSSCFYWDVRDNYHLIEIGSVIRYYLKPFEGDYIGLLKKGKSITDVTLIARGNDSNGVDVVKQYTPGTDGYVNVTSLYPTIELTTDTEGVTIEAEYNLDLNKASFGGGGSGEDGATFTPSVSSDGVISWTNDKGLSNPTPVNIKGKQGPKGDKGEPDYSLVANALKGTASGSVVSMKDVSPLEHPIGVKLSSDTVTDFSSVTLKKYSKNLYDSTYKAGNTGVYNGWLLMDESSKWNGLVDIDAVPDVFTLSTKIVCGDYGTQNGATTLRLNFYDADQNNLSIKVGTNATEENPKSVVVFNKATVPSGTKYVELTIRINSAGYNTDTQIELGTTATEYEPYKEPIIHKPNVDGTVDGVMSLYPITTLMTDTKGVTITAEYNKDTNMVVGDVETALDSIIAIQNSLIGGDNV